MENKRLLFVIDKLSNSGASKILCWLAEGLRDYGFESTIITHSSQKPVTEQCPNCNVINYEKAQGNKIIRTIGFIRFLRKHLRKYSYYSCIVFLPVECLLVLLSSMGKNTRLVFCERSDPYYERSLLASLGRFTYRFANLVVFQTKGAQDYFPGCVTHHSVVIPNPAFKSKYEVVPITERRNEIAYSGRLYIKQKRQDVLLEAFSYVTKEIPEICLIIYGDGPDRKNLEEQTNRLGITDRVKFVGNVSEVEEQLRFAKLLVLTSDYEGIPNVIIEALECGVPVVSTDCSPGGARLLIKHGENGYIVPRGEAKQVAEAIISVLSMKLEDDLIMDKCVAVTKEFDERMILQKWAEQFKRL